MESSAYVVSYDEHRLRCGSNCLKSLIVLINFTFMVGGAALIGLGIWMHLYRESFIYYRLLEDSSSTVSASHLHPPPSPPSSHHHHQQQQQQQYIPSSIIHKTTLIVVVALVVVIVSFGFLGCCGASVESICFLGLCVTLIASVVITEIVIASMMTGLKEKIYSDLLSRMQHQIRTEYNRTVPNHDPEVLADIKHLTLAWDTLQIKFNCCGANGPGDFWYSAWYNQSMDSSGLFVPTTCCFLSDPNPQKPVAREEALCQVEAYAYRNNLVIVTELRQIGCHEALVSYVDYYVRHPLVIVGYVVVIIFQLLDFIFCCILILWIRRKLLEIDASDNEEEEDSEQDQDQEDMEEY